MCSRRLSALQQQQILCYALINETIDKQFGFGGVERILHTAALTHLAKSGNSVWNIVINFGAAQHARMKQFNSIYSDCAPAVKKGLILINAETVM